MLEDLCEVRTGVVCEKMQGLAAKLRKLAGQAKICTPLGGEVIAKICIAASRIRVRPVGRPSFFVRGNMKPEHGAVPCYYSLGCTGLL